MVGKADYMKDWRKTPQGVRALAIQKKRERARRRALAQLEFNHQDEYNRLYAEHLSVEDIDG